jgi:hypothetical protein
LRELLIPYIEQRFRIAISVAGEIAMSITITGRGHPSLSSKERCTTADLMERKSKRMLLARPSGLPTLAK